MSSVSNLAVSSNLQYSVRNVGQYGHTSGHSLEPLPTSEQFVRILVRISGAKASLCNQKNKSEHPVNATGLTRRRARRWNSLRRARFAFAFAFGLLQRLKKNFIARRLDSNAISLSSFSVGFTKWKSVASPSIASKVSNVSTSAWKNISVTAISTPL